MICKLIKKFLNIFSKNDPKIDNPVISKPEPIKVKMTGYQIAQKCIGKNETENSDWIRREWKKWGRSYNEKTEWCSLFMLYCENSAGNIKKSNVPDNFEVARSWWNTQMDGYKRININDIKYGDIIISRRGASWQGHVGYFAGFKGSSHYYCLGGNKSDQVKVGVLIKEKIVGVVRYDV